MTTQDLRIGNWVNRLGEPTRITSITKGSDGFDYVSTEASGVITSNQIEPIPITEDILLKAGFVKDEDVAFFYDYGKITVSFPNDNNKPNGRLYFNSWAILEEMPKHLHTLQNVVHALTGEELTIDL